MCGIVGFTGTQQAAPILLSGLSKLEYRGYDSAGIAVRDGDKLAEVVKAKGRLGNLAEKTDEGRALRGTCGIGHTRWATHGEPSQINAHPHVSGNCTRSGSGEVESEVVGVHNGIIENYAELKDKLLKHGYTFYSETDTEVVIKLVDYYYRKYNLGPVDAIAKTMVRVRGSYALELMFRDYPGEIWVARKDSPMIIGITDGETYVASDVPAILKYTRQVYYIGNLEFARLTPGEAHFYNLNGEEIEKQTTQIKWDAEAAEKAGFEHFMMKEIHEQPKAIQDTLNSVIKDGAIDFSGLELTKEEILSFEQIYIVACGSAWHVGMAAQYVLEDMARIPVRVELASEFRYRSMAVNKNALVIAISQSGETADTLAALRLAKEKGMATLAIVNVQTSKEKGGTHRMNFEFMTIDTPLPPCMPFPRALTGFPVSSTAKVMYCRMLDAMLFRGQADENGILFVCFPITAIAAVLSRSLMTVKRSLNELETAGLIMRVRQGVGEPNRIYVLIPGKEGATLA